MASCEFIRFRSRVYLPNPLRRLLGNPRGALSAFQKGKAASIAGTEFVPENLNGDAIGLSRNDRPGHPQLKSDFFVESDRPCNQQLDSVADWKRPF